MLYQNIFVRQTMETVTARRPLKTRHSRWAQALARALAARRISPNSISLASVLISTGAAVALYLSGRDVRHRIVFLLLAAAGIQLRLVCNLLDGMVAVEGGLKTKSGEVFNDMPDRIADSVLFVAAGYAIPGLPYGPILGWSAALLAVLTAYVRMLGGAAGLQQSFIGPMAKQQRMAVLTIACVASIFETSVSQLNFMRRGVVLWAALIVVNLGCVVTICRRTIRIVRELEAS
jgi:phosphatidylglycerophosphate synthase